MSGGEESGHLDITSSWPDGQREWFEVKASMPLGGPVKGLIPRDACEALGIDTSPIDDGGTIWFTKEQTEAMRKHPEWEAAS